MAKEIEVVYEGGVFKPLENLADLFLPVEEEREVKVKEIIEIVEGREIEIYNPKVSVIELMSVFR